MSGAKELVELVAELRELCLAQEAELKAAATLIERQAHAAEGLVEALMPFALTIGSQWSDSDPMPAYMAENHFTVGNFRRARQALTAYQDARNVT